MTESIDDRRYRMQQEENARRRAMEKESQRKNDEYLANLDSGDVSPEVEAELTRSQAEKDMDDSMRKAHPLNKGGMLSDPMKGKYSEGGRLSVSEYVKARDKALKDIDNAESITAREKISEDFSKISKKFMEQESLGDSLDRERKEKAEALKKKNMGGMMKYNEGSMLVTPEMGMEDEIPVDTYDNIPEDEKAAVEASQLPDSEMEEDYTVYVLGQSLDTEEQEYLMGILETDERLSGIFDKVMDVAGEFSGEGSVEGPGTGTSDSIPARLSDGEFVFTKKATDQMGADQLQTMMDEAEKAYDGGYMKKAFGGLTSEDDIGMDSYDSEEEVKKQMISANQMPSIR